jgi:hypothetical protein
LLLILRHSFDEANIKYEIQLKVKAVSLHAMEALGGGRSYSSYSFSTSTLDVCEWSASRPGRALEKGKGPPEHNVQEAGWAPEPVWTERLEEKSFRLCRGSNLVCPVVQPVARHYADCVRFQDLTAASMKFSLLVYTTV